MLHMLLRYSCYSVVSYWIINRITRPPHWCMSMFASINSEKHISTCDTPAYRSCDSPLTHPANMVNLALLHSKPFTAGLGLISHLILNNGEYDHHHYILILLWVIVFGFLIAVEYTFNPTVYSIFSAIAISSTTAVVYFGSLLASILIYRAFFHRLRKV